MTFSRNLFAAALVVIFAGAGCTSPAPRASEAGVYDVGKLRITLGSGWYEPPRSELPGSRALSRTWSREGLDRDRLFVVSGVGDGEPIFRAGDYPGLPAFRSDLSPSGVADLVASSLQRVLWNGSASIAASNPRERGFTGLSGFEFELSADVPGAAGHRGMAGGFVEEGRLYLALYLAESPEYFERHREAGQAAIDSLVPTMKTIQW